VSVKIACNLFLVELLFGRLDKSFLAFYLFVVVIGKSIARGRGYCLKRSRSILIDGLNWLARNFFNI